MPEITHKLRFKDIEGDDIGSTSGWDINIETDAVHLVDPRNPDAYEQDSQDLVPAGVLLLMSRVSDDITVEEV